MKSNRAISIYYPELVQFFKNKEDADNIPIRSDKKVWLKCPNCGHEHQMIVKNLTRRHYSCPVCGDGSSFPERMVLSVLEQQKIEYVYQLNKNTFAWCGKYIYDFYLPKENTIIETDGSQHSSKKMGYKNSRTLEEEKRNDLLKERLAYENGIKKVIRIDFSNRDIVVCKKNITDALCNIIKTEDINWKDVVKNASHSVLYEVCMMWEKYKNIKNTVDIAKELNISRDKVVRCLHTGTEIGICYYNGSEERIRAAKKGGSIIAKKRTTPVLVFTLNNNFLGEFKGARYLSDNSEEIFGVKFDYQGIVYTCNGTQKSHRGFIFKYKENVLLKP